LYKRQSITDPQESGSGTWLKRWIPYISGINHYGPITAKVLKDGTGTGTWESVPLGWAREARPESERVQSTCSVSMLSKVRPWLSFTVTKISRFLKLSINSRNTDSTRSADWRTCPALVRVVDPDTGLFEPWIRDSE
jgi:hypothetical protein